MIECDVCVVSGEEKERLKDASKVKAQPTERIESPSTEIGRKAAVGRVVGRKMRDSVLETKFEMVRPPSVDTK